MVLPQTASELPGKRGLAEGWQFVVSGLMGPFAAFWVLAIYMGSARIAGPSEGTALLWPFCGFPVVLCIASFATGRLLRLVTDQPHAVIKSLLAMPAPCVIAYAIVDQWSPTSLKELTEDWVFFSPMLISLAFSWPLKFVGFHRWRTLPDVNSPPQCTKCGYNLTGNISGICPECGARTPQDIRGAFRPQSEKSLRSSHREIN